MYVEYSSNNSGGSWWMKDADWKALEKAGWIVCWAHLSPKRTKTGDYKRAKNGVPILVPHDKSGSGLKSWSKLDEEGVYRYMGALAREAYKPDCSSLRGAADEFDRVTSCNSTDVGCPCCGQPHRFTLYDDKGKYIESGPDTDYVCSW